MSTIVSTRADPELQRWRQQVAGQRRRRESRGARPYAALSYFARGPVCDGLIDVRRLMFVVIYDQQRGDSLAIRFAGYAATGVPWGVLIGGAGGHRFEKDLTRAPGHEARGQRFDLAQREVLTFALDLDRHLERHDSYPRMPRLRQPRWPQLWAAFEPAIAETVHGSGPEFEAIHTGGVDVVGSLGWHRRTVADLTAFPLDWVSHEWQRFTTVFADLQTVPKRQVFSLDHSHRNLCGFHGAVAYDLLNSKFRPTSNQPSGR